MGRNSFCHFSKSVGTRRLGFGERKDFNWYMKLEDESRMPPERSEPPNFLSIQRLGITLQRGNVASILVEPLPPGKELVENLPTKLLMKALTPKKVVSWLIKNILVNWLDENMENLFISGGGVKRSNKGRNLSA